MKNFKIGVNENGFHFQDSETGLTFTLKKVELERFEMAICSESADQDAREALKNAITECCFGQWEFGDISLEETYIAKNQDLFILQDIIDGRICILHKQTNKSIGLIEVTEGVPVIQFGLESNYGYDTAVKDFFELCSDKVQTIKAGTYHGKTVIQRKDTIKDIKQELLRGLVEGVKNTCLSKLSRELEYIVTDTRIIIKISDYSQIKIKNFGNGWIADQRESSYPILGLVYTIEAMKKFPQINMVTYRYVFEKRTYDVNITPKNINKVLKEAVKRRIIDLTV